MGESQPCPKGLDFVRITDEDDFCQFVCQCLVGCCQGTLLQALGQYDALLVGLGTSDNRFH